MGDCPDPGISVASDGIRSGSACLTLIVRLFDRRDNPLCTPPGRGTVTSWRGPRRRRLVGALVVVVVLAGAGLAAAWGLQRQLIYYPDASDVPPGATCSRAPAT